MSLEQKYGTATKFITMAPKVSRGISTVKPTPSQVDGAPGTQFFHIYTLGSNSSA